MAALKRLAVVVPPEEWFRGWPLYAYYETYRRALADLGIATIDVPMRIFLQPPDLARNADLLGDIRAFRPQAAIALHIATFLLHCRLPPDHDGWRPNFLTDVLDIPAIAIWDNAPFDLAVTFLDGRTQASPEVSRPGALAELRRAFCHRRMIHWSRDSGQSRLMAELGLLDPDQLFYEPSPTFPDFMRAGAETPDESVCFVGYLPQDLPPWSDPTLNDVERDVVDQWLARDGQSPWDILARRIAAVPPAERERLALDPDQSFFWPFAVRVLCHQAHTARRLQVLGGVGRPVTVYGNLDPAGAPANLTSVPGYIPPGAPLADVFARHAITVDVLNAGFLNAYGHKPMLCFGAGGFMLLDRKRDFIDAFGEIGEAVSYGSPEELAAKIDLYLSRPRLRAEIAAAMREQIAARHTLHATLERALARAGKIASREPCPAPSANRRSVPVMDLLPRLRPWAKPEPPWWNPARFGWRRAYAVSCDGEDWAYAATVALPDEVTRLKEPHLLITVATEAGRLGIGLLGDPRYPPFVEHFVGPSRWPVELTLELPAHDTSVRPLLRKTSEEPMRARVTRLMLCERR